MDRRTSPWWTARRHDVAALAITSVLLLAACSAAPGPSATSASPTATVAPAATTVSPTATPTAPPTADLLAQRTQAQIDVPGGPDWPIAAFDSLWVLAPDGEPAAVTRIDPATNEIIATIPLAPGPCQALGATDDAIWACAGEGVVGIDPGSNTVGPSVEFDRAQFFGYMPFGAGSLWVLGGNPTVRNQVVRIDPGAGEVVDTYALDFDASWITYGEDALWVTDTVGGSLWRLDPASGELSAHATGLPNPGPSAFGAGSIWLTLLTGQDDRPAPTDVTLVRVDPDSGAIEAEIVLGGSIGEVALHAADDAVWVRSGDPFLARVDPSTNEMVETFEASRLGGSLTVGYGSVWVTSYQLNKVWRIEP